MTTIILSIVAFIVLCFFIFLWVLYCISFSPMKRFVNDPRRIPRNEQYDKIRDEMFILIDELEKEPCEKISTFSYDNLRLSARYYDRGNDSLIEIDFHGYRGHALRDYCGGSKISRQDKRNAIIIDQRSHTDSKGRAITFGIKERFDVLSWVDYTISRFGKDVKIILSGISMGAATVLMASELDLPKNVIGIIADCPYTSPKDIICKVSKDKGLPVKLIYPLVKLSAKIFANADIDAASPIEAVKHTNIPILIIHGDDDRYVPYHMGKEVFEACASENKRFLSVKNAGHGVSFFEDR